MECAHAACLKPVAVTTVRNDDGRHRTFLRHLHNDSVFCDLEKTNHDKAKLPTTHTED